MNKNNEMKHLALFGLLMLVFLPSSGAVMVSGVIFDPEVDAGDHVSHEITVSLKDTENATDLTAEICDWNQTLDGGNIIDQVGSVETPYSAKSFLKITPSSIHLEPGRSERILVEGDIPSDAAPGGRYAIVSLKSAPVAAPGVEDSGQKNQVSVVIAYNVLIMIKVRGDINQSAEITDLSIEEPVSARQQNMTLTLKNTGNFHYKPDIEVAIKDREGNVLANQTASRDSSIIPPFSNQIRISLNPESELEPGSYALEAIVSLKDGTLVVRKKTEIEVE